MAAVNPRRLAENGYTLKREDAFPRLRKRLDFDPELIAELTGRKRVRRITIPTRWVFAVLGAVLVLVLALGAALAVWSGFFDTDTAPLRSVSSALIASLESNRLDDALALCAESDTAHALLQSEELRVAKSGAADPVSADASAKESRLAALADLRKSAEQLGVTWQGVQPLAFGGVSAQVTDPQTMSKSSTVVTGNVYFSSGAAIFAIELTAKRCGAEYVITDIWQCVPVQADAGTLESVSRENFQKFKLESDVENGPVEIKRPRHIFIAL